jgi:tetratricopeptide (TPR) repeat protein
MSTTASRKIARLVLAVAAWVAICPVHAPAQLVTSPSPPAAKRLSRSEHLRDWLAAIERHEPGRGDESIHVFDAWRPDDFQYLAIDVNTLLAVMNDPGLRTFYYSANGRSRQALYTGPDLRLILSLAKAESDRHGDVADPERRRERNRNRVLKRGVILHTDVAIDAAAGKAPKNGPGPLGLQQFTLLMPDGRSEALTVNVGHWEFARLLLDKVVPAAARDEFVRRWYAIAGGYQEGIGLLSPPHFTRGLHLFPEDADLLFQAACLHEALAEPRVQEAFQGASVPRDVTFDISSRRAELREAESLFRKALKIRPDHLEARIRLGRVLGLRGEHVEAEALLRQAAADANERLLQYYAQLFLGAEHEALGDRVRARDLYGRASQLYPDAQSPPLALSLLSLHDGNHRDALDAMSMVLALPGDTRVDPWWHYHRAQGRNAADDLAALHTGFLDEDRR